MEKKIIIDINKVSKKVIERFQLNPNENFEIYIDLYEIPEETIYLILENFEKNKDKIVQNIEKKENLIIFLYHYKMDEEIANLLEEFASQNLEFDEKNNKILNNYNYKLLKNAYKEPLVACENGLTKALEFSIKNNVFLPESCADACTIKDSIDCLKLLYSHGFPIEILTIYGALEYGSINCLRFIFEKMKNFVFDNHCCYLAASNGHLECLRFVNENSGLENMQKKKKNHVNIIDDDVCQVAAKNGHLDCLKYLAQFTKFSTYVCEQAAQNRFFDCLKFTAENCIFWEGQRVLDAAAIGGDIKCFEYVYNRGGGVVNTKNERYMKHYNNDELWYEFVKKKNINIGN